MKTNCQTNREQEVKFIDALDRVVTEMQERFNSRSSTVLTSLTKMLMGDASDDNTRL